MSYEFKLLLGVFIGGVVTQMVINYLMWKWKQHWLYKHTGILTGKDAERFERSMKEAKDNYERAKKDYESVTIIDSNEDD